MTAQSISSEIWLKKLEGFFSFKLRNFKSWKMPKLVNLRFSAEWYGLNLDNTELKRSSKIKFSVSERHR